jgi:hypothetical protein
MEPATTLTHIHGRARLIHRALAVLLSLPLLTLQLPAKKNPQKQPEPDQDQIQVMAHVPMTDGPVTRFFATAHYSQYYLYVEHGPAHAVTLIDITDPSKPRVLADLGSAMAQGSGAFLAVTGTAALSTDATSSISAPQATQTIRIVNFSDALHPKVIQEFKNVTDITPDAPHGLFFLANDEGVWILRQHYALDPKVEEQFEHDVLYNH